MTQPKPRREGPRYSVFEGTTSAFIVDDFEKDRDPVVHQYPYQNFRDRETACRKAHRCCAKLNQVMKA